MKRPLSVLGLLGLFIAASIGTQLGINATKAAFWQWSQTAATNASVDPNINWAEGMPPSVVNDSARAMMAALARASADNSGSLNTAGGPTAYTVTTNQGNLPSPPNDGQPLGVTFNVTNGTSATLAADGGTAKPINIAVGVSAPAGTLLAGSVYTMMYDAPNNEWLLINAYGVGGASALGIPLGTVLPYTGATVPAANFVFAAGQCLSTTTYAAYWALLGSPAPGACSAGNFAVVDLRGRVPAGLDNMISAASRLTSAAGGCGTAFTSVGVACANGLESISLLATNIPSITSTNASQSITVNPTGGYSLAETSGSISTFQCANCAGTGATYLAYSSVNNWTGISTLSATNSSRVTSSGTSGTAYPRVMPTAGVTYIIRVL